MKVAGLVVLICIAAASAQSSRFSRLRRQLTSTYGSTHSTFGSTNTGILSGGLNTYGSNVETISSVGSPLGSTVVSGVPISTVGSTVVGGVPISTVDTIGSPVVGGVPISTVGSTLGGLGTVGSTRRTVTTTHVGNGLGGLGLGGLGSTHERTVVTETRLG